MKAGRFLHDYWHAVASVFLLRRFMQRKHFYLDTFLGMFLEEPSARIAPFNLRDQLAPAATLERQTQKT